MNSLPALGRLLIVTGLLLAAAGLLRVYGPRWPWLGRLPGDIIIRREHMTFYAPIGTCVMLSVLATLAAWIWNRWSR